MVYTSLNKIRSYGPCADGWKNILAGQKKTVPDDVLFPLTEAIESNTVSDICWLIDKRQKQNELAAMAKFAKMCADSVAHLDNFWSRRTADYAVFQSAQVQRCWKILRSGWTLF